MELNGEGTIMIKLKQRIIEIQIITNVKKKTMEKKVLPRK